MSNVFRFPKAAGAKTKRPQQPKSTLPRLGLPVYCHVEIHELAGLYGYAATTAENMGEMKRARIMWSRRRDLLDRLELRETEG